KDIAQKISIMGRASLVGNLGAGSQNIELYIDTGKVGSPDTNNAKDVDCDDRAEACTGGKCDFCPHPESWCAAGGAACGSKSDFCSLQCNGGVCAPPVCSATGSTCQSAKDCCSESCYNGVCIAVSEKFICEKNGDYGILCDGGACDVCGAE